MNKYKLLMKLVRLDGSHFYRDVSIDSTSFSQALDGARVALSLVPGVRDVLFAELIDISSL